MRWRLILVLVAVGALVVTSLGSRRAVADLVVGVKDGPGGDRFPFAHDQGTRYQQVYSSTAFSGPANIDKVQFFMDQPRDLSSGTLALSFSTTSTPVAGLETSDFDSNPGAGGIPYVGPFLPAHFQHPEGTTGRLFSSAHDTGGGFEGFGLISGFPGVLGATVTAIPGVNAGEPYYLQQEPIMLADSVEGSYSQAAWDLGTDGFFDSPVGLRPVVSTTMVESWGFTPAMTGRSPYK